ncbi:hypothetical protein PPTG_03281 [Phytophthora nicotianae INRA-310]|uniref:RxLR effector PexRD54 WY domain-containing protein n=1 Tax=Phytophthora nicotianae (strain INRA-310) TaxID=761204 RepID=W2R493_PHYN3|nr:hypothetical protein PPTG_03281 [Phytophthora nicotianae INRA-310]ETN20237.1 hypothetical protein PPTG_03281 [Phytophthora nicotianae INRA-310]
MIIAAQINPTTRALADDLQARQLQYWLDNKKTSAKVFKLLKLNKAGDTLLDNPQIGGWLKYVADFNEKNPTKAEKSIVLLTNHYGDEALSKVLLEAKQIPSTASIADRLHGEQIQRCLATKEAPRYVFKFLTLDKAGDKLLENPQLTAWLKKQAGSESCRHGALLRRRSVDKAAVRRNEDPKYGKYGIYISRRANSVDEDVVQSNGDTEHSKYGRQVSRRTIPALVGYSNTPWRSLQALVLDKAGDKLLQNPRFATWIKYVDDLNSDNLSISKYAVMAHYYDDETLTKMLFEAMKAPSTANNAAKLHKEQIQYWLDTRKPPGDVFQLLSLDKAGEKLFDHPQFMKWVKYVEDLNKVHPDKKTTLISVLAKHYDSEALAKMMESAKDVPQSAKLVKLLETEQKWMTKETPDNLFKRLKLDQMENHVLSNTQLKTWINYMKEYNAVNPKYKATLIGTLAANYGELKVIKMLDEAAKAKDTAGDAKVLKNELLQSWMQKGWSPEYIFDVVLRLDQDGNKLFRNPLVTTWGKYLIAFNRDNYGKETTIRMMLAATGIDPDDLRPVSDKAPEQFFAMMGLTDKGHNLLISPEFAKWIHYLDDFYEEFPDLRKTMMTNRWSADQIFTILNLDRAGSSLFTGPWLDTWIRYMIMFEEWYFHNHMAKTLLKYYDENDLSQMVKMAKCNPNTEKLASYIENALLRFNNLPKSD